MDRAQGPRQEQRFQAESGRMTGAAGGPLESRAQLGQAPGTSLTTLCPSVEAFACSCL